MNATMSGAEPDDCKRKVMMSACYRAAAPIWRCGTLPYSRKLRVVLTLAALLLQPISSWAALDASACARLKASRIISPDAPVGCERLAIVRFPYVDFSGVSHQDGQLMVLAVVAPEVRQLFNALYQRRFPLERARLMEHYQGDDAAAMRDNNTSAFNNRQVTGGGPPSLHAYGLAIDINPRQNPYVQLGEDGMARFSPPAGIAYANRLAIRPGKPARPGMAEQVVGLFAEYGFTIWGGHWDTPLDYQHFQLGRSLAEQLATLPEPQARLLFLRHLKRSRTCLQRKLHFPDSEAGITCASQSLHP
jgi:hypothetical protein